MSEIAEHYEHEFEAEDEVKSTLAQNIAFFRKRMNLTQTELAKMLQYSNKNISKWEQGETIPDIFTLKKLSKIFGVSLDTLTSKITTENQAAITTKQAVPLRYKVYILALVLSILELLTCVAFFVLKTLNIQNFQPQLLFLYVLPLIDLTIFIFCCCIRKKVEGITLSLFGWLMILCFFITFIHVRSIGYIFVLGAAYQALVIAFVRLVNTGKIVRFNKLLIKKLKKEKEQQ